MFVWFFPEQKDAKLKYTQKEYLQLYDAVAPVLKRLGVQAVELEKVAYVLGHKTLLDGADLSKLEQALDGQSEDRVDASTTTKVEEAEKRLKSTATSSEKAKGAKRRAEEPEDSSSTKRQTRRNRS